VSDHLPPALGRLHGTAAGGFVLGGVVLGGPALGCPALGDPALGGPALGGPGLGRGLAHLFIWRLLWRAGLAIWRVPIFGPAIDIIIALVIVGLIVARAQLGPGWWRHRGGSGSGRDTGQRPRSW
jgi:hypothetical protein